jgi:heat shock protein HslJ
MSPFLVILIISACSSSVSSTDEGLIPRSSWDFSDIQGRDWILTEVRDGSNTVNVNNIKQSSAEVYSLRFGDDHLSGTAAPNHYTGVYTTGRNNNLSIGEIITTEMALLNENKDFNELVYYSYLNKVNRWEIENGKLELYSSTENGTQIVLVLNGMNTNTNDIQGKDWLLTEVKSDSNSVFIDRTEPDTAGIYTLKITADSLSGRASPNLYFGPYTSGVNKTLSIGAVASTLMASTIENEDFVEYQYFRYFNNVNRWELRDGNLELYSFDENGNQVVLIFS